VELLLAMFAFGLCSYAGSSLPDVTQIYFLSYGYVALVPVAALGLTRLWQETPAAARRRILVACAVTLAIGLIAAASTRVLTATGALTASKHTPWYVWYTSAYGIVGCVTLLWVLRLERHLLAAMPSRAVRAGACCIPLVVALGLVQPVAAGAPRVWETALHESIAERDTSAHPGITAALYQGLRWVKDHTPSCDVMAVNYLDRDGTVEPNYYYYSAFSERAMFLEGWEATAVGVYGKQPFPGRFALDMLATRQGNAAALRRLARNGVSYVLIDRTHGEGASEPASVSRPVFENSALIVYKLLAAPRTPSGCAGASP
jgi:hypothetical protein